MEDELYGLLWGRGGVTMEENFDKEAKDEKRMVDLKCGRGFIFLTQ